MEKSGNFLSSASQQSQQQYAANNEGELRMVGLYIMTLGRLSLAIVMKPDALKDSKYTNKIVSTKREETKRE